MGIANILTWDRKPGEFAKRVVLSREKLAEKHCDIVVEYGTLALFFKNGVFLETLEPGRHPTLRIQDRLLGGSLAQLTLVWVDCGAMRETFKFDGVRSNDNIPLQVSVQLQLKLVQPSLFCTNILKQGKIYSREELDRYFYEQLRNGVEEFIALRSAVQASGNRSFKNDFELSLREHLRNFLENDGFELLQVRAARFCNPDLEALRDFSGQLQIARQQSEYKLEQNKDELARDRSLAASDLERDIFDVARYKKKTLLNREIRKIQNQEQIFASRQQVRLERSLQEIESERLVSRQRQAALVRMWKEKRQDLDMNREFSVEKNLLQQRQYLEKLELEHKMQIERERLRRQLELDREELAGRMRSEALREISEEQSRRRKLKGTMDRRKFQVAVEADIAKIAMKTQKKRAEMSLSIREKMSALDFQNACNRLQLKAMDKAISEQGKIVLAPFDFRNEK